MPDEHPPSECEHLLRLIRRLRAPDGCPWDREQTLRTLTPYLLEETHEVLEALESGDAHRLEEELGDLLFILIFFVEVAEEGELFSLPDVVRGISEKITSRHPHVFEAPKEMSSERVRSQWEQIKLEERSRKNAFALKAGASRLPALIYALRIQQKAASYGFDWDQTEPILAKIDEELEELRAELAQDPGGRRAAEELGDLLFSIVNLARHANQDPERSLRGTADRFCTRFHRMATLMQDAGIALKDADIETMDSFWERAKSQEEPSAPRIPPGSPAQEP